MYINIRFATKVGLLVIIMMTSRFSHGQDSEYDSLLAVYLKLDSIWLDEIERDSLNIFSLIDSLASYNNSSQLVIRSSYSSQAYNVGRDYDIDQYLMSTGLSYYHRSGLYLDMSGQYYSDIIPKYNLTSLTLGYNRFITKKWGYQLNATHIIYHDEEDVETFNNTLNNGLGFGVSNYQKLLTWGVDYTYSFGDNVNAHRLVTSVTLTQYKQRTGFLKNFNFEPSLFFTMGSETIYSQQYNYLRVRNIIQKIGRERFLMAYRNQNEQLLGAIYEEEETGYFGPLNMQLSLPIQYKRKNLSLSLSYNINRPIALPSETLESTQNQYLSISVYYLFRL